MINDILALLKNKIETMIPIEKKYTISQGNNNGFEVLVPEVLEDIKYETDYSFDYHVHLGHHFPDIDILINDKKYGLELKSRKNGIWQTNGNSIFESITGSDYEEMYILFGSYQEMSQQIQVRYDKYWKVLSDIKVTHSPRFSINMDTTNSVFESSAEYEILRSASEPEKVKFVQNHLKSSTKGFKWYVTQDNEVQPINLSSLNKEDINRIIMETMVLYPQDIFKSVGGGQRIKSDYTRASQYIISTYYYFSPSFRDFFSAGGQWFYNGIKLPQVFRILHENRELLIEILEKANQEFIDLCNDSWNEIGIDISSTDYKNSYIEVLNFLGRNNFKDIVNQLPMQRLSTLIE